MKQLIKMLIRTERPQAVQMFQKEVIITLLLLKKKPIKERYSC